MQTGMCTRQAVDGSVRLGLTTFLPLLLVVVLLAAGGQAQIASDAACDGFLGYTFYRSHDSGGDDIFLNCDSSNRFSSLSAVEEECSSRLDCKAFNTALCMKESLKPRSEWSTDFSFLRRNISCPGLYVKNYTASTSSPCPTFTGWTLYQGKDSPGSDTNDCDGGTTLNAIRQGCFLTAGCVAFNTNGCFKTKLQPNSVWNESFSSVTERCSGMYVRQGLDPLTACHTFNGYTFQPNKDSPGNDMPELDLSAQGKNYTVQTFEGTCSNNTACRAFSTGGLLKNKVVEDKDKNSKYKTAVLCAGLYFKHAAGPPAAAAAAAGPPAAARADSTTPAQSPVRLVVILPAIAGAFTVVGATVGIAYTVWKWRGKQRAAAEQRRRAAGGDEIPIGKCMV